MTQVRNPSPAARTGERTSTGWPRIIRLLRRRSRQYALRIRELQRHGQTERRVHDFRVASQRLLVLHRVCDALLPAPFAPKLRRRVKRRVDGFRRLRDVQVLLLRIAPLAAEGTLWASLRQRLTTEESGIQAKLRRTLTQAAVNGERRLTTVLARALVAQARTARFGLFGAAMRTLTVSAQARTRKRFARVAPDNPESFHRLRLGIKRARYTLEILTQVRRAPWATAAHRAAKHWQDELGNIQDLRVLDGELSAFRPQDPSLVAELLRFRAERAADRNEAIASFLANRSEVEAFIENMVPPQSRRSQASAGPENHQLFER